MVDEGYILLKSGELFLRYGIKSVNMDDIARHLAVSKKTIYQFISDKNQIIEKFVSYYLGDKTCKVCDIVEKSSNVLEELYHTSIMMKEMINSINPTMLYDLKKYHPKAWDMYQSHRRTVLEKQIVDSLERGKNEGFFRKDINSRILARLRVEMIDLAFNPDVFDSKEFNITDVHMQFFDNFIYGLLTVKGHKIFNDFKQIIEEE
ncbi:MAG: TetR/AcrR family transcriptional regulator [Cytophagales bacterium]